MRRSWNPSELYEAKAHLARLLDRMARGEEICIIRNGRPVARLVSAAAVKPVDVRAVIAEIKEFRKGRILGDDVTIRELIEEGRRF